jgi:hypothetical protein
VKEEAKIFEVDLKTDPRFCSRTKKQLKKVELIIDDFEL